MTLTAAFRCRNGGILLCADREENDGISKKEVDKIYSIVFSNARVFLACAGYSDCIARAIEMIESALKMAVEKNGTDHLTTDHRQIMENALRDFFRDYTEDAVVNMLIVYSERNSIRADAYKYLRQNSYYPDSVRVVWHADSNHRLPFQATKRVLLASVELVGSFLVLKCVQFATPRERLVAYWSQEEIYMRRPWEFYSAALPQQWIYAYPGTILLRTGNR